MPATRDLYLARHGQADPTTAALIRYRPNAPATVIVLNDTAHLPQALRWSDQPTWKPRSRPVPGKDVGRGPRRPRLNPHHPLNPGRPPTPRWERAPTDRSDGRP